MTILNKRNQNKWIDRLNFTVLKKGKVLGKNSKNKRVISIQRILFVFVFILVF